MQNELKSNEWQRILVYKAFRIEIQKGAPNNWDFLQNRFTAGITSPLFNVEKYQDFEKSTPESCKIHSNLIVKMNFCP